MFQWLRMQVLGMEIPGLTSGKFFQHYLCTFSPCGDCSIRVSQSRDYTLVWYLLYNCVAVVSFIAFHLHYKWLLYVELIFRSFLMTKYCYRIFQSRI